MLLIMYACFGVHVYLGFASSLFDLAGIRGIDA
jgi:hypothetical protein